MLDETRLTSAPPEYGIESSEVGRKKALADEAAGWGGGGRGDPLDRPDLSQSTNASEESAGSERLVPCGVCGRTFAPAALSRHSAACERAAAAAARRKTFDSSKQRREGTDMEQFPTSPTSPASACSKSKTPLLKKKTQAVGVGGPPSGPVVVGGQFPVGGGACPHCERVFNQRALDRHVDWCSTRTQRPAQRDVAGEVALQRLRARTRYKPPTPLGTRAHQLVQPSKPAPQPEYDPYKSAAAQMKRLMASQLDLTAPSPAPVPLLSVLSAPTNCRSVPRAPMNQVDGYGKKRECQKSSTLRSRGSVAVKSKAAEKSPRAHRRAATLRRAEKGAGRAADASAAAGDKANQPSDKYPKKPDLFNLELFLSEGSDYIDPRLINWRDNLPVDFDADILRSSDSLLSDENFPKEFDSFTITKNQNNKNRTSKDSKERKAKSSSIDSLSHQYDVIMHSLESSINSKRNRLAGDVDLEDLISDFDRELAACGGGGENPCAGAAGGVDSDGNHPSGETDEERTTGSKASQDSAYNSLRRSRRGEGEAGGGPRAPRALRAARRQPPVDSSTPSSTESGGLCALEGGGPKGGPKGGRPARFCHECGCGFPPPPASAHFCASCGAKRLVLAGS